MFAKVSTQALKGGCVSGSTERESVPVEVAQRLVRLGRELDGATALLHTRAAEHIGLSTTDYKCLDLAVHAEASLTAGEIAIHSGLSTGAVTGVIDRLERAGYVRRVRDPDDRRKVLVEVSPTTVSRYGEAFKGLSSAVDQALGGYTGPEVATIERYLGELIKALSTQAHRLSAGDAFS